MVMDIYDRLWWIYDDSYWLWLCYADDDYDASNMYVMDDGCINILMWCLCKWYDYACMQYYDILDDEYDMPNTCCMPMSDVYIMMSIWCVDDCDGCRMRYLWYTCVILKV